MTTTGRFPYVADSHVTYLPLTTFHSSICTLSTASLWPISCIAGSGCLTSYTWTLRKGRAGHHDKKTETSGAASVRNKPATCKMVSNMPNLLSCPPLTSLGLSVTAESSKRTQLTMAVWPLKFSRCAPVRKSYNRTYNIRVRPVSKRCHVPMHVSSLFFHAVKYRILYVEIFMRTIIHEFVKKMHTTFSWVFKFTNHWIGGDFEINGMSIAEQNFSGF